MRMAVGLNMPERPVLSLERASQTASGGARAPDRALARRRRERGRRRLDDPRVRGDAAAAVPVKIPIGIDDFREMRREGYTYIDKSFFVREVLDNASKVLLLP